MSFIHIDHLLRRKGVKYLSASWSRETRTNSIYGEMGTLDHTKYHHIIDFTHTTNSWSHLIDHLPQKSSSSKSPYDSNLIARYHLNIYYIIRNLDNIKPLQKRVAYVSLIHLMKKKSHWQPVV